MPCAKIKQNSPERSKSPVWEHVAATCINWIGMAQSCRGRVARPETRDPRMARSRCDWAVDPTGSYAQDTQRDQQRVVERVELLGVEPSYEVGQPWLR